jgi:hypothetical protein
MEVHPGPVPRLRYCTAQWRYTAFAGGRLMPRWDDDDYPESPNVCLHRRAARYQREKVDSSFGSFCFPISPHSDQLRIRGAGLRRHLPSEYSGSSTRAMEEAEGSLCRI